jgi:uncharacterized protein (TIGR03086 family)
MAIAPSIEGLARALNATGQLIAGVRDDQWSNPTPCSEWNVRILVNHLVIGNRLFASILRGEQLPSPETMARFRAMDHLGDDPVGAYRQSGTALLTAFRQPGVLERVVEVPVGGVRGLVVPGFLALHLRIVDTLVHGWDLARATGRSARLPDDLAEEELVAVREAASGELGLPSVEGFLFSRQPTTGTAPAGQPFGPEQPVANDAPAIDRLAAFFGRPVDAGSRTERD